MTHRSLLQSLLAILFIVCAQPCVACQGRPFGSPTFTYPPSVSVNYSGDFAEAVVPVTITMPMGFNGICTMLLSFWNTPFSNTLTHTTYGQPSLTYRVGNPFDGDSYRFYTTLYGTQGSVFVTNIPIQLLANQTGKIAGTYASTFTLRLSNLITGGYFQENAFVITAHVSSSCTLPPPSLSSLDFSSAIHNATIPSAAQRSLTFNNAGCNGPARLTLSGQALTMPGNPSAIQYTAVATLGGTPVQLDTRNATTASASNISAPQSAPIPLTITVLPSQAPLAAGTYSSILRVGLEPAQ